MELFSPVFLPPEFLTCVTSLVLSVGFELRVSRKTLLIPKAGGKAHLSLVSPPRGSSAGTWWVEKPNGMEKWGDLILGTRIQSNSCDLGGVLGGAAWTCWRNQGHGMRSSTARELSPALQGRINSWSTTKWGLTFPGARVEAGAGNLSIPSEESPAQLLPTVSWQWGHQRETLWHEGSPGLAP